MGKKQPAAPLPEEPHKGRQINLRVHDPRLLLAIDRFGEQVFGGSIPRNRWRNSAILLLLERALREAGLWPLDEEQGLGAG